MYIHIYIYIYIYTYLSIYLSHISPGATRVGDASLHGHIKPPPRLAIILTSKLPLMSCSPPYVDRVWLRVYYYKIPINPIFYLLKGDYM